MKIQPFELERWQSIWENKVELNISESGVHPLSTSELVPNAATLQKILDVPQYYPQTNGSEELRSRIAELYPGAKAENVLVTCGGSEANFVATWALLEPGRRDRLHDAELHADCGSCWRIWRNRETAVATRRTSVGH